MNHLGKGTSPTENLIFDLKMIPLLRKEHDISSQTILIFSFPGTYLIPTHTIYIRSFLRDTWVDRWMAGIFLGKTEAPTANFKELNPKINLFLDTSDFFVSKICFGVGIFGG